MKILTLEEQQLELADIGDEIPVTQFATIDLDNEDYGVDIVFPRLNSVWDNIGSALVCDIGGNDVLLPLSWYIFIGVEDQAEIELVPVTDLNARNFHAIVTNPISGYQHKFLKIRPKSLLLDYLWVIPRFNKNSQALAIPIDDKNNCIYVTQTPNKIPKDLSPTDFM